MKIKNLIFSLILFTFFNSRPAEISSKQAEEKLLNQIFPTESNKKVNILSQLKNAEKGLAKNINIAKNQFLYHLKADVNEKVWGCNFSNTGKYLAVTYSIGYVNFHLSQGKFYLKIYDSITGKCLKEIKDIYKVKFSDCDRYILLNGAQGLYLCDLESGKLTLIFDRLVLNFGFIEESDGMKVFYIGNEYINKNKYLRTYDIKSQHFIGTSFNIKADIPRTCILNDNSIISIEYRHPHEILKKMTLENKKILKLYFNHIRHLNLSVDNNYLMILHVQYNRLSVSFVDIPNWKIIKTIPSDIEIGGKKIDLIKYLNIISINDNDSLRVLDLKDNKILTKIHFPKNFLGGISSYSLIVTQRNSNTIAAFENNENIYVWLLNDLNLRDNFDFTNPNNVSID